MIQNIQNFFVCSSWLENPYIKNVYDTVIVSCIWLSKSLLDKKGKLTITKNMALQSIAKSCLKGTVSWPEKSPEKSQDEATRSGWCRSTETTLPELPPSRSIQSKIVAWGKTTTTRMGGKASQQWIVLQNSFTASASLTRRKGEKRRDAAEERRSRWGHLCKCPSYSIEWATSGFEVNWTYHIRV